MRTDEEMTEVYWNSNNQNDGWRMQGIFLLDPRAVRCEKRNSATEAKELAEMRERGTFHWGRFYVRGHPQTPVFRQVRAALLGRS